MSAHDRLFVITGGPGAGKTALIEALADAGFACMSEAGRGVIREQLAAGGTALPWLDPPAFAERMLTADVRSYRAAERQTGPVFFDRGIPDVIGYLRLLGLIVPAHIDMAAQTYRYHRRVFIAPPWREIFTQDAERKQDFGEAERTCDAMVEIYTRLGYDLVTIPREAVAARRAFVVKTALG